MVSNFLDGDEFANVEASSDLGECALEWVVGWESEVNYFDGSKDEITKVAEGERIFWALVPRRRPTLMPSIMKCKVLFMLLMRGMDTCICEARGGRLGFVSKYCGPLRWMWRHPWRFFSWQRAVVGLEVGILLGWYILGRECVTEVYVNVLPGGDHHIKAEDGNTVDGEFEVE